MNEILSKEQLSADVWKIRVRAPHIVAERKPGQFIILQVDHDFGERIPLTIADADPAEGSITLVVQTVGATTLKLSRLPVGAQVADLLGPLGRPTDIHKVGKVVCVGGGIGVAPLYPIAKAMKDAGNEVVVIIGARNESLVVFEKEMRAFADEVILCTDDGSAGRKALVTAPLKELCDSPAPPDEVIAIGPPIMMKFCAETTRPYGIHTVVSLNTIMIDGTGMCGGCRAVVGGETKFVCVDGPEFDAHLVDFDNMMKRLKAFVPQEKAVLEKHQCNLQKAADALGTKN
jgi:ferredoxin--NADP+ reductase